MAAAAASSTLARAAQRQLLQALAAVGKDTAEAQGAASWGAIAVFGYGSNNVEQLRARLCEPALEALPCVVNGFERCFGGPNKSWSVEGRLSESVATASLRPVPGACTAGTVVLLPHTLITRLDGFEGVAVGAYEHTLVLANLLGADGNLSPPFPAVAYTRVECRWAESGPTEAYLCASEPEAAPRAERQPHGPARLRPHPALSRRQARVPHARRPRCTVKRNVLQSCPGYDAPLPIRDCAGKLRALPGQTGADAAERCLWRHPGFRALSLPAFLYEVGVRLPTPWVMPAGVDQVRPLTRRAPAPSPAKRVRPVAPGRASGRACGAGRRCTGGGGRALRHDARRAWCEHRRGERAAACGGAGRLLARGRHDGSEALGYGRKRTRLSESTRERAPFPLSRFAGSLL